MIPARGDGGLGQDGTSGKEKKFTTHWHIVGSEKYHHKETNFT